jgi:hypothetical protein
VSGYPLPNSAGLADRDCGPQKRPIAERNWGIDNLVPNLKGARLSAKKLGGFWGRI